MQEIIASKALQKILLEIRNIKWKQPCVSLIVAVTMVSVANAQATQNVSPIWGSSGSQNVIGTPLHVDDPTWGTLPSQQTLNPNSRRNANQRRMSRDAMGNPILTDASGNIVYDNNGNPAIDSARLSQQSFLDPNNDPASIPQPPELNDVPIDGGIGILLIVGMGVGYRNKKRKKIEVVGLK